MQQQKVRKTCMLNDMAESAFLDNSAALALSDVSSNIAKSLLALPEQCLEQILLNCDTETLVAINATCKAFRCFDACTGLRLVEKIARAAVHAAAGEHAGRWRRRSWLAQLFIEDSGVGFANFAWGGNVPPQQDAPPQYRFLPPTSPGSFLHIRLDGMGPKLLVSDVSTADQPLLRWRLVVRGNTAVEFGVVPLCLVDDDKALHKCQQEVHKFERLNSKLLGDALLDEQRPTGFCSSITVGSLLPFKTAIMKGSVVELLARRGRLEILVQNPPDGQELYWHNTRTVPKPYRGPREVRFEQDFSPHHDVKLALTSWAHGAFDVLHTAPGSRILGGRATTAWDRITRRHSSSDSSSEPPSPAVDHHRQRHPSPTPDLDWQQQPAALAAAAEQQQPSAPQPAPQPAQPSVQPPVQAMAVEAAAAAVANASVEPLQQQQQQQQQLLPNSPASDASVNSQEAMIQ